MFQSTEGDAGSRRALMVAVGWGIFLGELVIFCYWCSGARWINVETQRLGLATSKTAKIASGGRQKHLTYYNGFWSFKVWSTIFYSWTFKFLSLGFHDYYPTNIHRRYTYTEWMQDQYYKPMANRWLMGGLSVHQCLIFFLFEDALKVFLFSMTGIAEGSELQGTVTGALLEF